MRLQHIILGLCVLSTLGLFAGCGESSTEDANAQEYSPNWDDTAPPNLGKADFLGAVPQLAFNQQATGRITTDQVNLYRVELKNKDTFTVTMNVTDGDLAPDFLLFDGNQAVRSTSYDVDRTTLTKTYTVSSNGDYALLVRAYRGRGQGPYTIQAVCESGPCNGDTDLPDPNTELQVEFIDDCMRQARLQVLNNTSMQLTEAEATALFKESLQQISAENGWTGDILSCGSVCDPSRKDYDERYYCDSIGGVLAAFSDKSVDCKSELEYCMVDCTEESNYSDWEDGYAPENMCFFAGFNGTCDYYALNTKACGGAIAEDSPEGCMLHCWSTIGAYTDDLDTICEESCDCDDACYENLDKL